MTVVFGTLAAACSDPEPQVVEPARVYASVSGAVVFRERIGLTPESNLEIELLDVSLADTPANVIATENVENPGQSPIAFTLEYDPGLIDEKRSYSIGARVTDRGHLILISDTINSALTQNSPEEVTVYAVRVSQSMRDQPDASIAGTRWILSSVNSRHVDRSNRGPEIHMLLDGAAATVSGYAGCNQFSGSYELLGNKLTFGTLAATTMACADAGDTEPQFLEALGRLDEVRVSGGTLVAYRQGVVIASFAAGADR